MNKYLKVSLGALALYTGYVMYAFLTYELPHDQLKIGPKWGTQVSQLANINPIVRLITTSGWCSAWVIDANYAITAAHCINHEGQLSKDTFRFFDDKGLDIGVAVLSYGYDTSTDMAILFGDFSKIQPLATQFNQEGFASTKFMACGFPRGQKTLACSPFEPKEFDGEGVVGIGHFFHGMSGGPVINTETGEAVGIISSMGQGSVKVMPVQGILGMFGLE